MGRLWFVVPWAGNAPVCGVGVEANVGGRNYFGSSELQEKSAPVRGRALRPVPAGSRIQWQGHVRPRAHCQAVRPPSRAPRALAVSLPPGLTWYLPRGFLGSDFNLLLCHKDNSPGSTAVVISVPDFQSTCQTLRVKSSPHLLRI